MNEIWKDVVGSEGLYEVSNLGNVRSCDRTVQHKNGKVQQVYGRIMSTYSIGGYLHVKLSKDGHSKSTLLHRIVAEAFISNDSNLPQVNHIDCNKLNNNVSNLEWCTAKENTYHAYRNGLIPKMMVPIYAENLETGEILEFDSVYSFARSYNVSSAMLHLQHQTLVSGFRLRYKDAEKQLEVERINSAKRPIGSNQPIPIRCVETGETFQSIKKCGKHFSINDDLIREALRYYKGYVKKINLTFEFI